MKRLLEKGKPSFARMYFTFPEFKLKRWPTENDLHCRRFVGYNLACVGFYQTKCLRKSNGIPACFADISVERAMRAIKKIESS